MPTRQINFTGRKRLTASDVAIILHDEATPLTFDVTHLSLERHRLPSDSLVRVEAYHRTRYARFDIGTTSRFRLLREEPLPEFESADGVKFRIKVTSDFEGTRGQLLAEGSGIIPVWESGGAESLLAVRPASDLGHQVFRLVWEDGPVLEVNDRLTQWRTVPQEPPFVSLVLPALLREILLRIMSEHITDEDDSDAWPSLWIQFARNLTGIPKPVDEDEGGSRLLG